MTGGERVGVGVAAADGDGEPDADAEPDAVAVAADVDDSDDDGVLLGLVVSDGLDVCVRLRERVAVRVGDTDGRAVDVCVTLTDAVVVPDAEIDAVPDAVDERVVVLVAVRELVAVAGGVMDGVTECDGGNVATGYVWIIEPLSVCVPTTAPNAFRNCIVAPFMAAPCDAPLATGFVNGKRLKSTTRVRLYTPPRSTCHHAEPSHADMNVRSPTDAPDTPSI